MSVFTKRLKKARKKAGVSQEWLGILAGIDEMSASSRMNQYERGKHEPEFSMVERISYVLRVPKAYLFAKDDDIAWLKNQLLRRWPFTSI
ncbi:helix-turn-helix domain-containing protein [Serratia nematodiphila]|uniref:helix-turn-helix domain-containing protein n=1 Tax=Serratia nematodiphila TaxID=458197 RepID=UPI00108302EE|nr:helix-turn-helix transcriptional regulator [Serratia nematodiphila]UTO00477.1 helix-turn-helix domain-containing protein [Serratia nematodiphila]